MKRDFLKSLGLEDEAIDKIMSENGKDLEKAKQANEKTVQELENIKSKLEEKDQLINDANSQIEKFKGMDVESKDKAIQEWQEKYKLKEEEFKTKETEWNQTIENQKRDFAVKEYLGQHKFANDFVKEAFEKSFKEQGFKLGEDGKFLGADDYIKGFQEKNAGVFVVEEAPKDPIPEIVKGTDTTKTQTSGFNFGFNAVRPIPKE